jgi:hypothetical protein
LRPFQVASYELRRDGTNCFAFCTCKGEERAFFTKRNGGLVGALPEVPSHVVVPLSQDRVCTASSATFSGCMRQVIDSTTKKQSVWVNRAGGRELRNELSAGRRTSYETNSPSAVDRRSCAESVSFSIRSRDFTIQSQFGEGLRNELSPFYRTNCFAFSTPSVEVQIYFTDKRCYAWG